MPVESGQLGLARQRVGVGAGGVHRAVGSLGRHLCAQPVSQCAADPARVQDLVVATPGAGLLGAIRGRAQSQREQRGGEHDIRAGDPEPFSHGGIGVPRAALRDGQLRRRDEQGRREPGLRDRAGVGLAGRREVRRGRGGTAPGDGRAGCAPRG